MEEGPACPPGDVGHLMLLGRSFAQAQAIRQWCRSIERQARTVWCGKAAKEAGRQPATPSATANSTLTTHDCCTTPWAAPAVLRCHATHPLLQPSASSLCPASADRGMLRTRRWCGALCVTLPPAEASPPVRPELPLLSGHPSGGDRQGEVRAGGGAQKRREEFSVIHRRMRV